MVTPNSDNNNQGPLYLSETNGISLLEETLREIKQNNGLINVIAVTQQVNEKIKEYKEEKNNFYKIIFPLPWIILGVIEKDFEQNKATKPLFKYLYISWKLRLFDIIYPCSLGGLVITILSWFMLEWTEKLILLKLMFICITCCIFYWQIKISDEIIERIGFTKMYQDIYQVFDKISQEYLDFCARVVNLPIRQEDIIMNSEMDELKERLELEKRRSLQGLGAAIALAQAETDKQVNMILSAPQLQIDKNDKAHEIALKELEIQGQLLIEEIKILGKDHERARELEYTLKLIENFREEIFQKGDEALKTPEAQKTWENIVNRKPRTTS